MRCKKCKKELREDEYICENCFTIINLEKHEETVDKRVKEIGIEENLPKGNRIICEKCGAYVNIGKGRCRRCGHILDEMLFEAEAITYRQVKDEEQAAKNSRFLRFLCFFVPLLGLIMWLTHRKKDPILAELCLDEWRLGFGRARFLFIIIVACAVVFLAGC